MKKGTLYLIPAMLGDTEASQVLPAKTLEVIRTLSCFIAEELKTARRFLRNAGVSGDLNEKTWLVFNEHSSTNDLSEFIQPLLDGCDTGLLSEAGMPCIADPGYEIVQAAHEAGITVKPLTGPSSVFLALAASGMNGQNFIFHGYLPVEKHAREKRLKELEMAAVQNNQSQIFIETPYRNKQMLDAILHTCKSTTRLCIAADITLATESIRTLFVDQWKKQNPDIHKHPVIFIIG